MTRSRLFRTLWLWCWVAAGTIADAAARPSAEALLEKTGIPYIEARERLLATPAFLTAARATLASTPYGPETWRRLVLTEALVMHATHPQDAERLRNLEGLDPGHYLLRRRPEPSVARELRRMRHAAPLMIELFAKETDTYKWSSAAAAPAERRALRNGLLFAVGRSGHPSSRHFLIDFIERECNDCESRVAAIGALGETGSPEAVPVLLNAMAKARAEGVAEAHVAAIGALGRIRHAEVWPHIEAELSNPDPVAREAAIRAVGAYASRRRWRDDAAEGAAIREVAGATLVRVLATARDERVAHAALESVDRLATPHLRTLLERELDDSEMLAQPEDSRTAVRNRIRQALRRVDRTLLSDRREAPSARTR